MFSIRTKVDFGGCTVLMNMVPCFLTEVMMILEFNEHFILTCAGSGCQRNEW